MEETKTWFQSQPIMLQPTSTEVVLVSEEAWEELAEVGSAMPYKILIITTTKRTARVLKAALAQAEAVCSLVDNELTSDLKAQISYYHPSLTKWQWVA